MQTFNDTKILSGFVDPAGPNDVATMKTKKIAYMLTTILAEKLISEKFNSNSNYFGHDKLWYTHLRRDIIKIIEVHRSLP